MNECGLASQYSGPETSLIQRAFESQLGIVLRAQRISFRRVWWASLGFTRWSGHADQRVNATYRRSRGGSRTGRRHGSGRFIPGTARRWGSRLCGAGQCVGSRPA